MHMPFSFAPQEEFLFTTGPLFVGDCATPPDLWVSFDLRASALVPTRLFFETSAGSGLSRWEFGGLSGPLNTWTHHQIPFVEEAGWHRVLGSALFADSLMQVDAIGLAVSHFGPAADYELDNFRRGYTVPEPSQMLVLLASLSSLSLVFRTKLSPFASRWMAIFRRVN